MEKAPFDVQLELARLRKIGVPPLYASAADWPRADKEALAFFQSALANPGALVTSGALIYLRSAQETEALRAASQMTQAVAQAGHTAYMAAYPQVLDRSRDDDKGLLNKLHEVAYATLYFIGTEYAAASGFSQASLLTLLRSRQVAGKTTVMVSHLSAQEFGSRYGRSLKDLGAVEVNFKDDDLRVTVSKITELLKGG